MWVFHCRNRFLGLLVDSSGNQTMKKEDSSYIENETPNKYRRTQIIFRSGHMRLEYVAASLPLSNTFIKSYMEDPISLDTRMPEDICYNKVNFIHRCDVSLSKSQLTARNFLWCKWLPDGCSNFATVTTGCLLVPKIYRNTKELYYHGKRALYSGDVPQRVQDDANGCQRYNMQYRNLCSG